MNDKVIIRIPNEYSFVSHPEFICSVHEAIMWENRKQYYFECREKGCNQIIEFQEVSQIAQWLRGYA